MPHPSRESNELKGAAVVKVIRWRPEAEVLLNLKDQGLDDAFKEYSWVFSLVCF